MGSSRRDVKNFPLAARQRAGYELFRVQCGLDPSDWKPMPSVGGGVREIRIHAGTEHRILFLTRLGTTVYVLHAFPKGTRKTRNADLELARRRLAELHQTLRGGRQA